MTRSSLLKLRNRHFLAADLVILALSPALALALRTDASGMLDRWGTPLLVVTFFFPLIKLVVFYLGGFYSRYWRYASVEDLSHITLVGLLALLVQTAIFFLVLRPTGIVAAEFPRSMPLLDGLLAVIAVGALRFSVRVSARWGHTRAQQPRDKRVVVAGAGAAGVMIVREMQTNPALGLWPVAFVDDAPEKQRVTINGLPVLGTCAEVDRVAAAVHAQQVIIAMPTAPGQAIRGIVQSCERAGVETKTIPGMYELLDGMVSVTRVRDVEIADLLHREPIRTDITAVHELIRGRRVLITGAGGSIGGELCRQVLRFGPQELILLGHGENSIFEIYHELRRGQAESQELGALHPVIADIRSPERLRALFAEYRPEIVFHSAAHKHVPLMEENPSEAITNNVLGTQYLLDAAQAAGVGCFVLISTDKAVNPTSVMGASKRMAELLVHRAALESGKPYVAVRFGNVLGSRGSVVLTFRQQIAAGGPVTVTHPDMIRFFMTIPEAVQLVLQAATLGSGGEIFMLDMGEPVKIVDLARDLIQLSGLEEGRDIAITYSGIRPGEKLYEELFVPGEEYRCTRHEKIFTVVNATNFMPHNLDMALSDLAAAAQMGDRAAVLAGLQAVVPEYRLARDVVGPPAPPARSVAAARRASEQQAEEPAPTFTKV